MSAENQPPSGAKAESAATLALPKNFSVPVLFSQVVEQEGASVKELLAAEMRRMDEEMTKFSTNLLRLYGQNTVQAGMTSTRQENPPATWDVITKSPLVEEEGENKVLKLQFDVSDFSPDQVRVKIVNNMLVISAQKPESTDNNIQSEYHRDFLLPLHTKPETVQSSLSKNGVLTVRAPLVITPENEQQPQQTKAPPQPAGRNSNASNV